MRRFALGSLLALLLPVSTGAEPIAKPEAIPQQLTNNAPFSGAVYIVSPDGGQVVAQGTNMCPASASVSCANVNQPSWYVVKIKDARQLLIETGAALQTMCALLPQTRTV